MQPKQTRVWRNLVIGGEPFALVVETESSGMRATTAVHCQAFTRRIGGLRMARDGSLEEVGHLAAAMTHKCGASLLPFDGEKSLVCCADGPPGDARAKADLIAEHLRDVVAMDSGVTVGPDMAAGEDVMDLLGSVPEFRDHVTGRSEACGGLGVDTNGATAEGLVQALEQVRGERADLRRVTLQGFGAVGAGVAERLPRMGLEVVAVGNRLGTLESLEPGGLDVGSLLRCRAEAAKAKDELELARYAATERGCRYAEGDRGRILAVQTDIFVPAARTMVLAYGDECATARHENAEVQDVRTFLRNTGAQLILEGGNHPLSVRAEEYLEAHGVRVMVDYLVNMGGLVSCFFEWLHLPELLADSSAVTRVNAQAIEWTRRIGGKNASALLRAEHGARRTASELAARNTARMRALFAQWDKRLEPREAVKRTLAVLKAEG